MKFILLIVNAEGDWQQLSATEQERVVQGMNAVSEGLAKAGKSVTCGGLAPAAEAKTVWRTAAGREVRDGLARPLTERKELVTGFFVIEVDSMAEAIEWAKKLPIVAGGIEIRRIAME